MGRAGPPESAKVPNTNTNGKLKQDEETGHQAGQAPMWEASGTPFPTWQGTHVGGGGKSGLRRSRAYLRLRLGEDRPLIMRVLLRWRWACLRQRRDAFGHLAVRQVARSLRGSSSSGSSSSAVPPQLW